MADSIAVKLYVTLGSHSLIVLTFIEKQDKAEFVSYLISVRGKIPSPDHRLYRKYFCLIDSERGLPPLDFMKGYRLDEWEFLRR